MTDLQPFQQRVVEEKSELDDKLSKLKQFTVSETFSNLPPEEQGRLNKQHSIMEDYSQVLFERILEFV